MQSWLNSKSLLLSRIFTVLWALLLAALDLGGYPIVRWFGAQRGLSGQSCTGILVVLYACSVLGWVFLWSMWKLLGNLRKEQVFTAENVRLLNRLSWCCAGAAALCLAGCFFYLPFLFAVAAAGFMSLIVRLVRNVFQQAVQMKDELDLMI